MKKTILSLLVLSSSYLLQAQSSIVSAGGDVTNKNGSVSFSIGQVAYVSASNQSGSISQGVQQTYQVSTAGLLLSEVDFSLSVFPNPTTKFITLEVGNYNRQPLNYVLLDATGRQIQTSKLLSEQTEIDLSMLPTATYMIDVFQENQKVQSFKILKLN